MADGSPPVGYARIGVFRSNEANARSGNIPIVALTNMLDAARAVINTPAPADAVKNAIAGIIGPQWLGEANDWYLETLLTHGFEWTDAERARVVELFGA